MREATQPANANQLVILLHGLARTSRSLKKLQAQLRNAGYQVVNQSYASRKYSIEVLAENFLRPILQKHDTEKIQSIHFITHSMGGILVRYYLSRHKPDKLGRVVMLSPPNHGSEIVDKLKHMWLFRWLNGPAGQQLGTDITDKSAIIARLGEVNFPLGVITGDKSLNLLLSRFLPKPNDGKVSVASAQLAGMQDFLILPYTHTFIMRKQDVIQQAIHFIRFGKFK